jgi:hypothetical protein
MPLDDVTIFFAGLGSGRLHPVADEFGQRWLSGAVWARTQRGTCSPISNGIGSDTALTLRPLLVGSSSHWERILLLERSNLFESHWSNQWLTHRVKADFVPKLNANTIMNHPMKMASKPNARSSEAVPLLEGISARQIRRLKAQGLQPLKLDVVLGDPKIMDGVKTTNSRSKRTATKAVSENPLTQVFGPVHHSDVPEQYRTC